VKQDTLAFWDAYLKKNPTARRYLQDLNVAPEVGRLATK